MTEQEIMERLGRGQSIFEQAVLAYITTLQTTISDQADTITWLGRKNEVQTELLQNLTKHTS
jgi:hypothetical protein